MDRAHSGSADVTQPQPVLRGTLHLAAAIAAPAGLVALLLIADSPRRYVGASIFATSLMLLYASSASYHLGPWSVRLRAVMERVDHSMIFVFIAGTYTPFCLIVLDYTWGIPMLAVVWTLAALGVFSKIFLPHAPRWFNVAPYLALGWIGVIPAYDVVSVMTGAQLALLMSGGMLYTVGALVYARRWPDPFPRVFGFHEIFHLFVVAGSATHFALIAVFVANA